MQAAYQIVRCVGLTDGAVNVEMKMTSVGPRLIEINARMGGYYNSLWIKQVLIRKIFRRFLCLNKY